MHRLLFAAALIALPAGSARADDCIKYVSSDAAGMCSLPPSAKRMFDTAGLNTCTKAQLVLFRLEDGGYGCMPVPANTSYGFRTCGGGTEMLGSFDTAQACHQACAAKAGGACGPWGQRRSH